MVNSFWWTEVVAETTNRIGPRGSPSGHCPPCSQEVDKKVASEPRGQHLRKYCIVSKSDRQHADV